MRKADLPRRLSFEDAAFVNFERPSMPMNVGSVAIFEGRVPFAGFQAHVERRIDEVPRYRQRLIPIPFGIAHPVWADDPAFDVRNHVKPLHLPPPGDDRELARVAGEFFARPLDRERPLWEIRLVHGLHGGRTAQLSKIHHCMVDGVAGIGLLAALLDAEPGTRVERRPRARATRPLPHWSQVLIDAACDRAEEGLSQAEALSLGLLHPLVPVRRLMSVAAAFEKAGPYLVVPGAAAPWNGQLVSPARVVWQELPLDLIREAARRNHATLNDVVLALLAGALGRYLEAHGHRRDVTLRVATPVNLRPSADRDGLGNRVSMMLASLPVGERDPVARVRMIHLESLALKRSGQPHGVDAVLAALGNLPPMAHLLVGRSLTLPNRLANLICTNVPGPRTILYCMGHRMTAHYPWVPLGWRMGLGLAVMNYDRGLYFSFTADAHLRDDPSHLGAYVADEFGALCEATGIPRTVTTHAGVPLGDAPASLAQN